ncbi:MAG TPA: hypothetical protein EYG14_01605 [Candidatus Poseidoniales archaeon]|nr:hypothetical protein [Candidatus Poseidoniales archaeon]HIK99658.1 hypothetical protein [Candidatus Poseidoniales archaeon]
MSEDGMHKNVGGRQQRPLTHNHSSRARILIGFSGLRGRAKLTNAIGYDAKDTPQGNRGKTRETGREKLL